MLVHDSYQAQYMLFQHISIIVFRILFFLNNQEMEICTTCLSLIHFQLMFDKNGRKVSEKSNTDMMKF